jgi:hypothetical protein
MMKQKKRKQFISGMLVLILILNILLPVQTVFANETDPAGEITSMDTATPSDADREPVISDKGDTSHGIGTPSDAGKSGLTDKINPGDPMATPSIAQLGEGEDITDSLGELLAVVKQNGVVILADGKINSNDPITVDISFDLPVEGDEPTPPVTVKKNDTAYFELSNAFKLLTGATIPLKDGAVLVGHVSFITDPDTNMVSAKILFDGDDEVFDGTVNTVKCQFHADFQFDSSGSPVTGGEQVVIILDKDYTVVVPPAKIIYGAEKIGTLDLTNKWVEWKVTITATQGGGAIDLEGYKFSDDLKNVGTYIPGSFSVTDDPSAVPEENDSRIEYVFPAGAKGPQTVSFKTEIPEDLYFAATGEQKILNKAGLYDKEDVLKEEGQAEVSWTPKWIEKSGETNDKGSLGVYDPKNRTITWTIIANHKDASLKQVVITDILSPEIIDSAKKLMFDSATLQKWDGSDFGTAVSITPDQNGEYAIGDIDSKILLTIVTKVPDDVLTTGKITYYNQASIKWQGSSGTKSGNIGVGIGYNAITKSGKANPSEGTVSWKVTVDPKEQPIPDPKVYDLLVYGGKASGFDISSVTGIPDGIKTGDLKVSYGMKYIDGTFTGSGLSLTVLPIIQEGKRVGDLLEVTGFITGAGATSSTFTYDSQVLDPKIFATNESTTINNTATLFSGTAKLNESTAGPGYNSKMLLKEMLKREAITNPAAGVNNRTRNASEGFDYKDKSVIFRLNVNANHLNLSQMKNWSGEAMGAATVTDTLPEGWVFDKIDGSNDYLIFEGTGNSDGSVTASGLALETVSGLTSAISGRTASFTFQNMDRPYVILIKARPDADTVKNYFNSNKQTTVQNNLKMVTEKSPEVTSTQNVTIVSEVLGKTSSIKSPGVLLWSVEYKPSEFLTSATKLYDTLPIGIDVRTNAKGELLLEGGNFSAYEMILQANGSYILGDAVLLKAGENIFYDNGTRGLTFPIQDSKKAYRFSYLTDVTGEPGNVSNKVMLYGGTSEGVETSKPYQITNADGQASMQRNGWISITKTDMAGTPLKNAEFTLFAQDGKTIIRKGMTTSDGTLKFKVIPNGSYILKETKAPTGYILEGVTHTLTVSTEGGAVTSSINGKSGSGSNAITVKNVLEGTVGNLKIMKTVAGNAADTAKKFDFTVTFRDDSETYSYVGYGVPNGAIKSGDTISLGHGDSINIQGLPRDTDYTVTEADYTESGYITVSTGDQGTIEADAVQTASFTNTKNAVPPVEVLTGDLTISKTVSGNGADIKKKFEFTVTFDNAPDAYSYTGNGITGGIIHSGDKISLSHGQSITITGLPAGAGYHVEEADYSSEKYTVVSVGAEGSIEAKTTRIAAFTNTKQTDPEKPDNGGGSSGGGNIDVKSPKVPKSDGSQTMPDPLVNIVTNTPTGNKVGTPEETVITSNQVPKGTKYGKNDGLPKTGDESNSFKSIYALLLVFAGLSALLLSFMLFLKTRREK